MKKDYDSTRIYRNTHKKRVRHRLMTHPRHDLISDQNRIKFIPIIRKGSKEESYPHYLGNRKGLDMRDDSKYKEALNELVDNLEKY